MGLAYEPSPMYDIYKESQSTVCVSTSNIALSQNLKIYIYIYFYIILLIKLQRIGGPFTWSNVEGM